MDSAFSSTLSNLFGINTGEAAKSDGKASIAGPPVGSTQDGSYTVFTNTGS